MPGTENLVILLGRVGSAPEMVYTPKGTAVTRFRLATDRYTKSEEKPPADWHSIVAWDKNAENLMLYAHVGDKLHIVGELRQEQWEGPDGGRRYRVDVRVQRFSLLSPRKGPEDDLGVLNEQADAELGIKRGDEAPPKEGAVRGGALFPGEENGKEPVKTGKKVS